MDGERFDSFARSMGRGVSRRAMLKALLSVPAAAAATTVLKQEASAAGYGEHCGGLDPPGPVIGCSGGLHCCAIASNYGICLSVSECNDPSTVACSSNANCPGNFACCSDGRCSSDYWGECSGSQPPADDDDGDDDEETPEEPEPTTTTPEPASTTTTAEPPADDDDGEETPEDPEPGGDSSVCVFEEGECAEGLICCPWGPTFGICIPQAHCDDPTIRPCGTGVYCPGMHAICCDSGFCNDYQGVCSQPTTTTPAPGGPTTTTPAPGTSTTPAPGSGNTGTGTGVEVVPAGVPGAFIRFGNVTVAGQTTVAVTGLPPTLPNGSIYATADGVWYEITTTAVFSGGAMICLPSSNANDRILHFEGGSWVDITFLGEPTGGSVCGEVDSFSPFAVVPLLGGGGDGDDDDDKDPPGLGGGKPQPPYRPQGSGGGSGSTAALPSTGAGPAASSNLARLGLTLAASAAAAAAARALRPPETERSES